MNGTNPRMDSFIHLSKNKIDFDNDGYPCWICNECATSRGYSNRCTMSTYHEDACGWCEEIKAVTQPRDYGYPRFSK